jgi:inosine-uridine nucleoside N-ribohydrolase/predicted ester cyclase
MRKCLLAVLSLLCFSLVNAQTLKPMIIDTDLDVDDWLAILYLLQRTDVEVLAITVTGAGAARCDPGVQHALDLVALAGSPEIPVACGREMPLQGNHAFPDWLRDNMDALAGLSIPANNQPPFDGTSVELLAQTIHESLDNMTLVTLGPLTNIAELLEGEPSLIDNLEMIYVMGGAVSVPGNVGFMVDGNTVAEANIYVDPQAAAMVFASGAPITLVPLDATNYAPVTMDFYARIENDRSTPEADFVYQALTQSRDFIQSGGFFFWDPLAAAIATDNSLARFQGRAISVIVEEGAESGQTFADASGSRVRIAVEANGEQFETIFLNVLNGRDPSAVGAATEQIATSSSVEESNKAVVRRYYEEVWGHGNLDILDELLDPSYVSIINSTTTTGDRATIEMLLHMLHTALPDCYVEVEELIAEGDVVAARVVLHGTHTRDFGSFSASGNPIEVTMNSTLHLANGLITGEYLTLDAFTFFAQIGAIPEEIIARIFNE